MFARDSTPWTVLHAGRVSCLSLSCGLDRQELPAGSVWSDLQKQGIAPEPLTLDYVRCVVAQVDELDDRAWPVRVIGLLWKVRHRLTHHDRLGVASNASAAELEEAWQGRVCQARPILVTSKETERRARRAVNQFIRLSEAYLAVRPSAEARDDVAALLKSSENTWGPLASMSGNWVRVISRAVVAVGTGPCGQVGPRSDKGLAPLRCRLAMVGSCSAPCCPSDLWPESGTAPSARKAAPCR